MTSMLDHGAPPEPMAALTHTIITPANIALDARINRAKPMGRWALLKKRFKAWRLEQWLRSSGWAELETESEQLEAELKILLDYKYQLAQDRQDNKSDKHLNAMWEELRATFEPKAARRKWLTMRLETIRATAKELETVRQSIDENPKVIQRAAIELEKMRLQRNEAKAYEQLLIDRWTSMGYCYRFTDSRGNKRTEEVSFSERHITPDAIWLKIGASYRQWTGGYKTRLPYGVKIADLLKPETLEEVSYACQRQVTAKSDFVNGAWIIVNRLDTTDGLLNQVRYADVMERYPTKMHHRIPVCVGVAERKQVMWMNLTDYPHGLIAGFTGSGKSNFINAIICTLITKHEPVNMRLLLVDLKEGVEFDMFEHIPHLYCPIVDKVSSLAERLEEIEAVMQERYEQIRAGKTKNIDYYNAKHSDKHLARIIVFIDEVVSTMDSGDYTKRISASLKQLVAKGRAAGIHIILSTQRPSVDAIQGMIKVNLAFRIVGRMPSHADSLTVLGSGAAKELPNIPGRMVMQLGPDPMPIQTPMIEISDLETAISIAMDYAKPDAIPVPDNPYSVTEWSPERIIELSINHLGGNISHIAVWEEIKEENSLSRSQTRALCERVWAMDCINFEGKQYHVVNGKGKIKKITLIEPEPVSETLIS